jgi:glycosyltransferase involved in cell wall biosynthesis
VHGKRWFAEQWGEFSNMDGQQLVSIIIPVFNIDKYLATTLDSVLAQTYRNIEVILIDDGSSDASGPIGIQYAQKNTRVRYIYQQNQGVSASRNRGIREAAGDYLMFVDGDDLVEPGMIEACLRARHDSDLVIFGMLFDTFKGGELKSRKIHSHQNGILTHDTLKDSYLDLLHANYFSSACNKLYKRSVIVDHNVSFDESLSNYEDLLFSLDYFACVKKAVILSEPYYHYCKREREGLSRMYKQDLPDKMIYLITELRQQYGKLNLLNGFFETTAHLQEFYVMGLCNICRNGGGMKEQNRAVSNFASNPVFSNHGIFEREYGNHFTRLCRSLTLNKRWSMLVIACRTRNLIRRIHY